MKFFNFWKKALKTGVYEGPVVFVAGSHYPCPNGHGDLTQRVLWDAQNEAYMWALPEDPTHQHLYENNVIELPVRMEE